MKYIYARLPEELPQIDLYAVSDVHRGHALFDEQSWFTLLDKIRSDPKAYLVFAGDGLEMALKSAKHGNPYEHMRPKEERILLEQELATVRDKILGIIPGNHEERARDSDENPLEILAYKLDLVDRYDPISLLLEIGVGRRHGQDRPTSFVFHVAHGTGGGKRPGGKLNRIEEFSLVVDGVDGYIQGHVHDLMSRITRRMSPDMYNKVPSYRSVAYVIAGSMLRYGDYAERKGLPPNAISMPVLHLYEKRSHEPKRLSITLPSSIWRE